MSRHDFTLEEFTQRRTRVREAMRASGLDWLILFHPVSIHWLTGSDAKSYQAFQCLIVPAADRPSVMLTRESERNEFEADALVEELDTWGGPEPEDPIEVFERVADRLHLRAARLAMEVPAYYLHPLHYERIRAFLGSALAPAPSTLVGDLKAVKSPAELAYSRRASEIADAAMMSFRAALAAGRTELQLAGEVYRTLLDAGSGFPASTLNFVSGERAGFSHGAPTARALKRGDFGNIEFGAAYRRYTATIGRQFAIGQPSARMREVYDVVRRAQDAAMAAIADGVPAIIPHEAAKRVIAEAGLDRYRVHTSGYGLAPGFPPSWGDAVNMFGGTTSVLRAGMVVTIEPPVFIGAEGIGARLIDNVIVAKGGAERLSKDSRDLIVVD